MTSIHKRKTLRHRHTQEKDQVKTLKEEDLQAKKRGPQNEANPANIWILDFWIKTSVL